MYMLFILYLVVIYSVTVNAKMIQHVPRPYTWSANLKINEKFEFDFKIGESIVNKINLCVNSIYSLLDENFPEIRETVTFRNFLGKHKTCRLAEI